jgi:hydroxyacylglutathione hydrolase
MMTAQSANSSNNIVVATFPVGALQCNCSIIACKETGDAIVVDPGGDAEEIVEFAKQNGWNIKYLIHTHAHFDHILGARQVKEKTGAKIALHKEDNWLYENVAMQGSYVGLNLKADPPLPADHFLEDEEELHVGNIKAKVIHTPGHTPGSLCFNVEHSNDKNEAGVLFAGDTLFHGSIGRTDLWGGSMDEILKSIKNRLLTLDETTQVICGHGPDTSIWTEKRHNPFVGAR